MWFLDKTIKFSNIVGETTFSRKLNIKNDVSNHRILKLPCWTSISKSYSPSFHGIYDIITIKNQSFLLGPFLIMKFFTPKLMKIECYLGILKWKEVNVQNFNTMEIANFLEKNPRLQHQFQGVTSKITSRRTICNFSN